MKLRSYPIIFQGKILNFTKENKNFGFHILIIKSNDKENETQSYFNVQKQWLIQSHLKKLSNSFVGFNASFTSGFNLRIFK